MQALKILCWVILVSGLLSTWSPENYRSNAIIYATSLLVLAAIFIAEKVFE